MSGSRADIARAEANAVAARARFSSTFAQLKDRLDPAVRAREFIGGAREKGEVLADDAVEFAYERSGLIMGLVGVVTLVLVRRPLVKTIRGIFHREPSWGRRPKWDVPKN